jgi:hypothetical protein
MRISIGQPHMIGRFVGTAINGGSKVEHGFLITEFEQHAVLNTGREVLHFRAGMHTSLFTTAR